MSNKLLFKDLITSAIFLAVFFDGFSFEDSNGIGDKFLVESITFKNKFIIKSL